MEFNKDLEHKCQLCKKPEKYHKGGEKYCPEGVYHRMIGYTRYSSTNKFIDGGLTVQSKRQLARQNELMEKRKLQEEKLAKEKAKVRNMTLEQVVAAVRNIIFNFTGLRTEVIENRATSEIHVIASGIRLGYTSVTKTLQGSYIVGGTSAGCFMANHSDHDISNVLKPAFEELEELANKEKVTSDEADFLPGG